MIKLLHTADWHIGKMLFGRSMLEDQKYIFDTYFFPTLKKLGFGGNDCVVLSGDIFDRAVPPVQALELFDEVITRLSELGVKLIAITGNHDGAQRLSMGTRLMKNAGVYLFTDASACGEPVCLDDGHGTAAAIYPLPYFDIAGGRAFARLEGVTKYADIFSHIVNGIKLREGAVNILVGHCTVLGSHLNDAADSSSVGGSDEVDGSVFSRFDLTLLGHLHMGQSPRSGVYYSGSPLCYSFGSAGAMRSMRYFEIEGGGVESRTIDIEKPLHPMKNITGSFEQLTAEGAASDDGYVFVSLTDDRLIYEPMLRLREKYPNILGMCYAERSAGGSEYRDYLRGGLRSRSIGDAEVFDAFLRQMCGTEPDEKDFELFAGLCEDAFRGEDAQ